jgi:autotransporter-associated beta strand protein
VLSGANTYTGTTTVTAGTLKLAGARTVASGAFSITNGGTLEVNNASLNFSVGINNFTLGANSGTSVVNHIAGKITVGGGSGDAMLIGNGNVNATGEYNLSGGLLEMTNTDSTLMIGRTDAATSGLTTNFNQTGGVADIERLKIGGTGTASNLISNLTLTGGIFTAVRFDALGEASGTGNITTITIGGTADVTLPAFRPNKKANHTVNVIFDGGVLKNTASPPNNSNADYFGNITSAQIKDGGARIDTTAASITIIEPFANFTGHTGSFTKDGANTLTLSATNTYTGVTTVNGGTLSLSAAASIASSSSVILAPGGNLDTTAKTTYAIPTGKPVTFGIDATASGSSGRIVAAGLDITNATVNYSIIGTPDDPVYILATYTSLTGANFTSVPAPPPGYTLDYAYEGNKIALLASGGGAPESAVDQGGNINSGGPKAFGTVNLGGTPASLVFTINNTGTAALNLTATPPNFVAVSGTHAGDFTVTAKPASSVVAGGSTTFTVQFAPLGTTAGTRNATLTILNNDSDEGSFTINLSGTAQTPYQAWAAAAAFKDDANGDGVENGLAFLLGASGPNANALDLLPTATQTPGGLVIEFSMLKPAASGTATLSIQHSSDLGLDGHLDHRHRPRCRWWPHQRRHLRCRRHRPARRHRHHLQLRSRQRQTLRPPPGRKPIKGASVSFPSPPSNRAPPACSRKPTCPKLPNPQQFLLMENRRRQRL